MAVAPSSTNGDGNGNGNGNGRGEGKKSRLSLPKKQSPAEASSSTVSSPDKRTKSPGVRVVGGRIYDSEHGKTCHQCRQKTMDFVALCTQMKQGKPCTIKFCHKCLLNRYGEKAEEVALLKNWTCPKCRGVCNCSFCMKKRGQRPTGILAHTAKASGFSSVLELLHHKGHELLDAANMVKDEIPKDSPVSEKGLLPTKRSRDGENCGTEHKSSEALIGRDDKKDEPCARKEKRYLIKKLKGQNGCGVSIESCRTDAEQKEKNSPLIDLNAVPLMSIEEDLLAATDERHALVAEDSDVEVKPSQHLCKPKKQFNSEQKVLPGGNDPTVLTTENNGEVQAEDLPKPLRSKKRVTKSCCENENEDVVLPQGTAITEVAGVEVLPEDVGPAFQFMEFCDAFSKVLDIKKGQPESVLRELVRGRIGRRGVYSSLVQLHMKFLSLIQMDMGEEPLSHSPGSSDLWLQALAKCIDQSECAPKDISLNCLSKGFSGYENLSPSEKLRVLNFLCDETLGTEELRQWIDEENTKFLEKRKEAKEKALAAKKKEKELKKKLKDDVAKAMLSLREGASLSVSQHDNLISEIRAKADKAHAEMKESMDYKTRQRRDAVRTEPLFLQGHGHVYWKLGRACGSSEIVLQDVGNWDSLAPEDKWFAFDEEEGKVVEKLISLSRNWRPRRVRNFRKYVAKDSEEMKHDSPNDSTLPNCSAEDCTASHAD